MRLREDDVEYFDLKVRCARKRAVHTGRLSIYRLLASTPLTGDHCGFLWMTAPPVAALAVGRPADAVQAARPGRARQQGQPARQAAAQGGRRASCSMPDALAGSCAAAAGPSPLGLALCFCRWAARWQPYPTTRVHLAVGLRLCLPAPVAYSLPHPTPSPFPPCPPGARGAGPAGVRTRQRADLLGAPAAADERGGAAPPVRQQVRRAGGQAGCMGRLQSAQGSRAGQGGWVGGAGGKRLKWHQAGCTGGGGCVGRVRRTSGQRCLPPPAY